MSFEAPTHFVQQYGRNVFHLSQQKGARLRSRVMVDAEVIGKTAFMDQLGPVAAQKVTQRHGDSPLNSTPHRRRRVSLFDYDTGDLVDELDKAKTLNDLTNPYAVAHGHAMARGIDDEIIKAAFEISYTGEDGSIQVAFPAGQQIAVDSHAFGQGTGNAGLTISKLIEAKKKLDEAEVDEEEPRYIACTAQEIANLLQTTEVTNRNYNTIQALVEGKINTFMGFEFVRSERLLRDTNGYTRVMCWAKNGIGLAIGKDIKARIRERSDKRFSVYVYYCMSIGASRLEEAKVVEIKCDRTV